MQSPRVHDFVDPCLFKFGEQDGAISDVGIDREPVAHLHEVDLLALLRMQQRAFATR